MKLRILQLCDAYYVHLCNYVRSLALKKFKYEKNPHGVYVYISGLQFMIALDSRWYRQLGQ